MLKRFWKNGVAGWVIYDFGNVIFSLAVVSLYFPLWVVDEAGGSDGDYALVSSISVAIVLIIAPLLGAASDRVSRRMPLLIALTTICCLATAMLGSGGLMRALILFVIANSFYQFALLIYDTLLPTVSTETNRGRVSGWGFAAGFGGALTGILVGMAVLAIDPSGHPLIYVIVATLFFALALPCFRWVKEVPRPRSEARTESLIRAAISEVRTSFRDSRAVPGLQRYLVGRFFYGDAINTAVIFMSIYATEEVGMSDFQVQLVLLIGIVIGPVGALWSGASVDRVGPKWTLNVMLLVWGTALFATAMVPLLGLPAWLFWIVAPLIGIGLGGTSTTERAYLLRLVPPDHVGRFLGLNAMIGRFAAVLSPLLWILLVEILDLGRPIAVLSLLAMLLIARVILSRMDDSIRTWESEIAVPPPGYIGD